MSVCTRWPPFTTVTPRKASHRCEAGPAPRSARRGVGGRADLLRQLDDDPRRAAHVAEQVGVLVVLQLADELATVRSQGGEGRLDVVDDEEDVADARGVG